MLHCCVGPVARWTIVGKWKRTPIFVFEHNCGYIGISLVFFFFFFISKWFLLYISIWKEIVLWDYLRSTRHEFDERTNHLTLKCIYALTHTLTRSHSITLSQSVSHQWQIKMKILQHIATTSISDLSLFTWINSSIWVILSTGCITRKWFPCVHVTRLFLIWMCCCCFF